MAPLESVLTGFDCISNNFFEVIPITPISRKPPSWGWGGGAVGRGGQMTFQTTVKYVFAIMKLDVPRFLVKKTNILHFYSVHRKKTYLL